MNRLEKSAIIAFFSLMISTGVYATPEKVQIKEVCHDGYIYVQFTSGCSIAVVQKLKSQTKWGVDIPSPVKCKGE